MLDNASDAMLAPMSYCEPGLIIKDKNNHEYKQSKEYKNIIVKKICISVTHDKLRSSGMITRHG